MTSHCTISSAESYDGIFIDDVGTPGKEGFPLVH